MIAAIPLLLAVQLQAKVVSVSLPDPSPFVAGKVITATLDPVDPGCEWDEVVPSWNLENPEFAALTLEARVVYPDRVTNWYSFGPWSLSPAMGPRQSVEKQRDDDGVVLTDTLRVTRPGGALQLRITAAASENGPPPKLRLLALSFSRRGAAKTDLPPLKEAWGKTIDPPKRAQGDYPNGKVLCSPTCTSMVLGYWAKRLRRSELDLSVPEINQLVWDPVYNGAGNWSYNVALAGSNPDMVGYAARLSSLSQLERWTAAGVPVVTSVSWYLLHGQEIKPDEKGHLVVLVGFTKDGDPVFNDPGNRKQVRRTFKRSDFAAAWDYSQRTVYIIHPRGWKIPEPQGDEWLNVR